MGLFTLSLKTGRRINGGMGCAQQGVRDRNPGQATGRVT